MRTRLHSLLAVLVIGGIVAWFFHECLWQEYSLVPTDLLHQFISPYNAGVPLTGVQNHYGLDVLQQFYPWNCLWQQSLRRGELPLWDPSVLGGTPHLAASMPAVLNPFKLLLLVLPAERAFSLGIVLELFLAAVFLFAFLRELELSRPAAVLGAIAFALNSAFLQCYWSIPNVMLWAPLALLLFERSLRRSSWGDALGCGLILGLAFVSGNIQSAAHLGLLSLGWFAGRVAAQPPARRRAVLGRSAAALLVGILLAAVQWLPTLELLLREATGRLRQAGPQPGLKHAVYSVPLLVTFIFPGLAGGTEAFDLTKLAGGSMMFFTGYIGLVPFALFLIGLATADDARVRPLRVIIVVVFVIVFFTPLVRLVYDRLLIVATFAMAVIAAYGLDALLAPRPARPRAIARILTVLAVGCLLVAMALVALQWVVAAHRPRVIAAAQTYVLHRADRTLFGAHPDWLRERAVKFVDHYRLANPVFAVPLATLAVALLVWRVHRTGRLGRATCGWGLVALAGLDLITVGRAWVPQVDLRRHPLFPPLAILAPVATDPDLFRVQRWAPRDPLFLPDNILTIYGLSTVSGYESIEPENLRFLPAGDPAAGTFNALLDLQNVKYVVAGAPTELPAPRFELVRERDGARLYRNRHCRPRAQFFSHWQIIPDRRELLRRLASSEFHPDATVLLEQEPTALRGSVASGPNADATARVEVIEYRPGRVRIRVQAPEPGLLLLADTWYPGWQARVDGQSTTIYRADYVLRAVAVPAGEHAVEFRYAPVSFRCGSWISGTTVGGLALLGIWRLRSHCRPRTLPADS